MITMKMNRTALLYSVFVFVFCCFSIDGVEAQGRVLTVRVDTVGTLSMKIDAALKDSVVGLTVEGEINGSDILYIREMAGSDKNGNLTGGNLSYLDLTKTHIREGGAYYYSYYPTLDNKIGNYMFYRCKKLTTVYLPESALFIGNYTFAECGLLKSVYISRGLKSVGTNTFFKCVSFSEINVDVDNEFLASKDGVLFDKQFNSLILYPLMKPDSVYNIPPMVKYVGNEAFKNNMLLKSLVMPGSLTTIGVQSFYGCESLNYVKFSDKLTEIPNGAFSYCKSLVELDLPKSLISIDDNAFFNCKKLQSVFFNHSLSHIGTVAFAGCESLSVVSLPGSLISLGSSVFSSCTSIEKVVFPSSLETTGYSTFAYCYKLESVIIPEGVTTIGSSTFRSCQNLISVLLPKSLTKIENEAFQNCIAISEIEIPESVSEIESNAFQGCLGLKCVFLPKDLKNMDARAFNFCMNLENVRVDSLNDHFTSYDGVLYSKNMTTLVLYPNNKGEAFAVPEFVNNIGRNAFSNTSIKSIVFSDNVESVGDYSFSFCNNLTEIDLNCVVRVGLAAFSGCNGLKEINMPYVFEIESSAFSGCKVLENVVVSDELLSIKSGLFYNCTGLQKVVVGKRVGFISTSSFSYCKSLKEIYVTNPEPAKIESENVFDKAHLDSCILYVPKGTITRFRLAYIWSRFKNIVEYSPVAVSEILNEELPEVVSVNNTIKIYNMPNACIAYVYNLNGDLIAQLSDKYEFSVRKRGLYIVRINGRSYKVKV